MRNDHITSSRFDNQLGCGEVSRQRVDDDLGDRLQLGKSPLVVGVEVFGVVCDKDSQASSVAQLGRFRQPGTDSSAMIIVMDARPAAWLTISDHDDVEWRVDADFLQSSWTCIWDKGCVGIDDVAAPELGLGCCSVGVELLDEEEAMRIAALGATLAPDVFQNHDAAIEGVLRDDIVHTRVVDGACIFLNRPGFAGGAGCALHAQAVRDGESPLDWKPSVCWQLPLRVDRSVDDDGMAVATLRRWSRADWGPDGETMAWCCTEGDQAYVGNQPVLESLDEELRALMGDEVVVEIRRQLGRD